MIMDSASKKEVRQSYSDYPEFSINVESMEEIFAEKIRSLIERTKCRDYFDVWKLCSMDYDKGKAQKLFREKCEIKQIQITGLDEIFPTDIESILMPYWNQQLGRLINPLPDLHVVLNDLKTKCDLVTKKWA